MAASLSPADVELLICGSALGAHPGAEVVGIVSAAGESAAHLADRCVLVPRLLPCGECEPCRRGRVAVCATRRPRPRHLATREVVPARFLLPLEPPFVQAVPPADSWWRYAALSDALLAPYSGLVRVGQSPGGLCVVLGGGARAAAAVLVIRALGCQAAVLCPRADERERLCAPPYGALAALDPAEHDSESALRVLRELAVTAGLLPHGLTHLETTGSDAGRARALGLLEAGGVAVLLDRSEPLSDVPAVQSLPAPLADPAGGARAMTRATAAQSLAAPLIADPSVGGMALLQRVSDEQCQILGAGPGHPDLLPELVALLERAQLDLSAFTRTVALGAAAAELADRRAGRGDQLTLPIVRIDP